MATQIKFYVDEMMPRPVAEGLEKREIEVLVAVDAGMAGHDDVADHLPFAAGKQAVLVTLDRAFAGRAMQIADHTGVICWTGKQDDIGGMVRALAEFAETHTSEETTAQVFWLK